MGHIAAQLEESTKWCAAKFRDAATALGDELSEQGLHAWGDELDDAGVAALDKLAKKFVRKVTYGPLVNGEVLAKGKNVWSVTELAGKEGDLHVEVAIELADPKYAAHLAKGQEWGTSPPNFGDYPSA